MRRLGRARSKELRDFFKNADFGPFSKLENGAWSSWVANGLEMVGLEDLSHRTPDHGEPSSPGPSDKRRNSQARA